MKKIILVTLMGIIGVFTSFGQSELNLDAAIQQAGKAINDAMVVGAKTALLNCVSGSNDLSGYVMDKMTTALDGGRKLTLVAGKDVDRGRTEMNFQSSSQINDTPALELGKKIGAWVVVTSSFEKNGNDYRYTVRALDVTTRALLKSSSFTVKDDQQVRQLMGIKETVTPVPEPALIPTPASTPTVPPPVPAAVAPATPPAPMPVPAPVASPATAPSPAATSAYKIGDTGPAGGLIFYDKGNNSDGWRYLEAAPKEAEFQAAWSDNSFNVNNNDYKTRSDIGFGKRNTQAIVERFREVTGNWNTAAQKAHDISCNGFNDWFLPSQTELDQIFGNLKRKNLGDFKNELYWSSTEYDNWRSRGQNFKDGKVEEYSKSGRSIYYVRPIRQVAGQ